MNIYAGAFSSLKFFFCFAFPVIFLEILSFTINIKTKTKKKKTRKRKKTDCSHVGKKAIFGEYVEELKIRIKNLRKN